MLKGLLYCFGMPAEDIRIFEDDKSGYGISPAQGYENMDPNKRVLYLQQREFLKYFNGPQLHVLTNEYCQRLSRVLAEDPEVPRLSREDANGGWIEVPDLYDFLRRRLFRASTETLLGELLWKICPTLYEDFWDFDSKMATLITGPWKWWAPQAYKSRERMHKNVSRWLQAGSKRFAWDDDAATGDNVPWEPLFGSAVHRSMQRRLRTTGFTDEGKAAQIFALITA